MDGAVEERRGKRRYQRATQSDGLPWNEGIPVQELDGEKLHFEEKRVRGSRLARYRFDDEADPPPVTLFQLSIGGSIVGHRGSLFIATKT